MRFWKKHEIKDNIYLYIFLLLTGMLVIFGRSSHAVLDSVMYTEDAAWTSSIIYNGFVNTCLDAKGSYLVVGNVLMLEVALKINQLFFGYNVIHLATILAIVSYIYYDFLAFCGVYLLRNFMSLKSRIFLFYGILMLPMGDAISEMYGRASNIGYGCFYIAFVIMLWFVLDRHDEWKKIINYIVLLLCCVTNPVCYIVLAFVLCFDFFSNIKIKNVAGGIVSVIVGVISVLSLVLMYMHKVSEIGQTANTINWAELIEYFFRSWMYNFVWPFYHSFNNQRAVILMLLFAIICVAILWTVKKNPINRRLLLLSYVTLLGYTVATLYSRKSLTWQLNAYSTTWPDRYFYVQNILVIFILSVFISLISSQNMKECRISGYLVNTISFLGIYVFVLIGMLPGTIFEGRHSRCVDTSITLENSICSAYYQQGDIEDYTVFCPFSSMWEMKLPKEYMLASMDAYRNQYEKVELADFTDEYWNHGMQKNGNLFLFNYTEDNLNKLKGATIVSVDGVDYYIGEVERRDEYIYVSVNSTITNELGPQDVLLK